MECTKCGSTKHVATNCLIIDCSSDGTAETKSYASEAVECEHNRTLVVSVELARREITLYCLDCESIGVAGIIRAIPAGPIMAHVERIMRNYRSSVLN